MQKSNVHEQGNIFFYILIGIILVGALTVAVRNSGGLEGNIDREDMFLKATQVQKYGSELAHAVQTLLENNVSEADIRFAHDDADTAYGTITANPENQVFDPEGGGASYRVPPTGVNDGSLWEFAGTTDIPQVGSDKAELVAVLPAVTQGFCQAVNSQLGFTTGTQPTDSATGTTPDCIMVSGDPDRFVGTFKDTAPNIMDDTSFSRLPVLQGCVYCASDDTYNYFYVLLAR